MQGVAEKLRLNPNESYVPDPHTRSESPAAPGGPCPFHDAPPVVPPLGVAHRERRGLGTGAARSPGAGLELRAAHCPFVATARLALGHFR